MKTILIPSTWEAVAKAIKRLVAEIQKAGYGSQDVFAVHLALEEALVNAIEHGNKLDPAKKVSIRYEISPDEVRFSIVDEGEGFSLAQVPDPTRNGALEQESGRGILLMRTYMDEVTFSQKGNEVALVKYAGAKRDNARGVQSPGRGAQ